MKYRYYLLDIKEICGEYEFSCDYLILLKEEENIEERISKEMEMWRGEAIGHEDDWYNYGDIIAKCESYTEVPEEDYKILDKYL